MAVQAVLFNKNKWTLADAKEWLNANGYKPIKRVHITENFYRYRIMKPIKNKNYSSKKIGDYITLIMMH